MVRRLPAKFVAYKFNTVLHHKMDYFCKLSAVNNNFYSKNKKSY